MSNIHKDASRMEPDARREQILKVAAAHFSRDGRKAVSIQTIASEAGVTRALVYHYFPGKDALFEAVLQAEADALLDATRPDHTLSPDENIARAVGAYLDHFAAARGKLRDLYTPREATAALAQDLTARNHDMQIDRIIAFLGQPDAPSVRLAIGAWLGFVTEAARLSANMPSVSRGEIIALCLAATRVIPALEGVSASQDKSP